MAPPDPAADDDVQTVENPKYVGIANALCPVLNEWPRTPQAITKFVPDSREYFGVRQTAAEHTIDQLPTLPWGKGEEFILDFGIHMVGYLSFDLNSVGAHMDAPCRMRLTFGESPIDVTKSMDNVQTWISSSWLPDEVLNIDDCPSTVRMPRRYSFRYLRVQIIDTSPKFKVSLSKVVCKCVSAIGQDHPVEDVRFQDQLLQDIDHVSMSTLRDCMQTVFEDGPRRDRRLWLGDLRLQALANYATFKDFRLVKRCLYQFAAFPRTDGSIPACIFEKPTLEPSTDYIVDYDALFAATLYDYVMASGDLATGRELWGTVEGCLKRALSKVDPETKMADESRGVGWIFLDWEQKLEHSAGLHGVLVYCLKRADWLAARLGMPTQYANAIADLTKSAAGFLSKAEATGPVFVSGRESQISHASAAWLVLADVFPRETAQAALRNTLAHPDAVRPLTPYLWHHVCDALASVGLRRECLDLVRQYWGGMIRAGADTFWECFDPKDPKASPYGDVRNNSFCHAWSCTPTYFLRGVLKEDVVVGGEGAVVSLSGFDKQWVAAAAKRLGG